MYPTSSTTYAQAQAGGVLRLANPPPRTGHPHQQFNIPQPHQMSNPAPWGSVPYQPLSPLGVPVTSFDHARPPPDSPPALIHSQSPYATIPLPRQLDYGVCVSMNPLLKYGSHCLLQWDITTPPGCATPSSRTSYHPTWVGEPAVRPNLRTFAIWLASAGVDRRPIVVHARDNVSVTVYDVLYAIYKNVLAAIDSVPGCYGNRNEAVRVLFGGTKVFAGLTESTTEVDVWVLHVR